MSEDERPDKHARIFIELELIAQWATCQRGRVASALVDSRGVIIVPARNGTPHNQPHCAYLTNPDERCQFCIHSEKNVINHAARQGIQIMGNDLYTLKRPCLGCANDILEAGIGWVYYRWDYDTDGQFEYVRNMLGDHGIGLQKVDLTDLELSFSDMLQEWRATWTKTP